MKPIHLVAEALGIAASGPSACAVCGPSPFGVGRPSKDVFGPAFVDYDLIHDSRIDDVCEGCAAVLGGKPSRENPPIRMGHVAVVNGVLERPDGARLLELIRNPEGVEVLCWTATRQRHTILRAEPCTGVLGIGTETGTLVWERHDVELLDAVSVLRQAASPDHIATGDYPAHIVERLGAQWEPAEAVVSRYRPGLHLDLAVALVRRPETTLEEAPMPIPEKHREAASLLLLLVSASPRRAEDGIAFWASLVPRRMAAAAQAADDLLSAASRLMEALQVSPLAESTRAGVRVIEAYTEEEAADILHLWRNHPTLIITFARMIRSEQKEAKELL